MTTAQNPKSDSPKSDKRQAEKPTPDNRNDRLEEGLEETFPASDPVSVTQPGTTGEVPERDEKKRRKAGKE